VSRALSVLLVLLAACADRPAGDVRALPPFHNSADSAFTLVQARGQVAMGVDQYTSVHHFEPLADGGTISLQRDHTDSAGVAQIRSHMETIAASFKGGYFALPGFVHDREVPGTGVMAAYRSSIRYTVDTLSGGARLRLTTADPVALAAIHEFLAFQRHDHRASGGAAH
jgi:hypothetical protein